MSGVDLRSLDASDLVDVLHFLFEKDATSVHSAEHAKARDAVRKQLYETLYDREYLYAIQDTADNLSNVDSPIDDDVGDLPVPVDPFAKSGSLKPYIQPTMPELGSNKPFGAAIDAPLG